LSERRGSRTGRDPEVLPLVEQLVHEVATHSADRSDLAGPAGEAEETILDVEVEGVRCLLVRREPRRQPRISLSPREYEISRMVAKGYPNKTIAAVLEISSWTVGTYLRRIFAKLGVSSRAAMVARLLEEGLIRDHPNERRPPTRR
jgi:DNA-binding CsgD family transcriptional regulator